MNVSSLGTIQFDIYSRKTSSHLKGFVICLKKVLLTTVLRIDNSGRSVIHTFDDNSETMLVTIIYDILNKR